MPYKRRINLPVEDRRAVVEMLRYALNVATEAQAADDSSSTRWRLAKAQQAEGAFSSAARLDYEESCAEGMRGLAKSRPK